MADRRRVVRALLTWLVAALAVGGCGHSGAARDAPTTANLWVAPAAGTAPQRCATPCTFDPAKAYDSFQAAYAAASGGDAVRVNEGNYGAQTIDSPNPKLTAPVTFEPARGEAVTLRLLDTQADWITVKHMTIAAGRRAGRGWRSSGSHVTLDHVDITGPEATITISGGSDVAYRNSALGSEGNTTPRRCENHNSEPLEVADTTRLTLYNVTFWPFIPEVGNPACGPDRTMHLETVRINDNVQSLVINRARFMPGDGSGSGRLFESGAGGKPSSDALIVNSYFGPADGPGGSGRGDVRLAAGTNHCDGWVFAYTFWTGAMNDASCPVKPTYIGNLGAQPDYLPCPGSSASHNLWVWSAAKAGCGTDNWLVHPDPKLDAFALAPDGYHLTGTSPAIDAGDEALCARYTGGEDIDGDRRTGTCDAGPDEYVP